MALTAGWPLDKLLGALSRAGWDELAGGNMQGVRSTLRALSDLLPHGSATGRTTVSQVADAAGLSVKWAGRCLRVLEECGLIVWTRGQVVAGRPRPGYIKVVKSALVALIQRGRELLPEIQRTRAAETLDRIRTTLRTGRVVNRSPLSEPAPTGRRGRAPLKSLSTRDAAHNPLSVHMELSDPPPPNGEGLTTPSPEKSYSATSPRSRWQAFVARRNEIQATAHPHETEATTNEGLSA